MHERHLLKYFPSFLIRSKPSLTGGCLGLDLMRTISKTNDLEQPLYANVGLRKAFKQTLLIWNSLSLE